MRNDSESKEMTKASIVKRLREQRLKITPQRMAIIETFLDNISLHPGARLIYEQARKKVKSLSLSTAYATLTQLSEIGIIKTLEFDKMENRYEGTLAAHINLVCKGCQKIMDFKSPVTIDLKDVAEKFVLGLPIPG